MVKWSFVVLKSLSTVADKNEQNNCNHRQPNLSERNSYLVHDHVYYETKKRKQVSSFDNFHSVDIGFEIHTFIVMNQGYQSEVVLDVEVPVEPV